MSAENSAPGVLVVRAQVRKDLCRDFDRWYEVEHLPEAKKVFDARTARRGWSRVDDGVHCAIYEFESTDQMLEIVGSTGLRRLLDAFDAAWPEGVTRTREFLQIDQSI